MPRTTAPNQRLKKRPAKPFVGVALATALCAACQANPPPQAAHAVAPRTPWLETGQRLARQGDSVRAEQYLARAMESGDRPTLALGELLKLCIDHGRLNAALGYASRQLQRVPSARLRLLVANLQMALGLMAEARVHARLALAKPELASEAHLLLSEIEWEGFRNAQRSKAHLLAYRSAEPGGAAEAELRLARIELFEARALGQRP